MKSTAEAPSRTFDLPDDHPGRSDPEYLARRATIAAVGEAYRPGDPIPDVPYSTDEDGVWATVSAELGVKHGRYACKEYLRGAECLKLPTDRVPQLREVDAALNAQTGWHIRPVAGLVPTRVFYGALADRTFPSTQYIRHHSVPFYTPEPDIIHEIVGHANMLASPVFADLYERAGKASLRATTEDALDVFSRVFWFTLEFGVLREAGSVPERNDGEVRAYGAGLLSSFGEIEVFRDAEIRPWDLGAMATLDYDITRYQPVLFAAESFEQMVRDLGTFFDEFDDEAASRLKGEPA